jgi:O-methyltransferase
MNLPGIGEIPGAWDLRTGFDAYIGGVNVTGERVLEIGPATGFVTMELERRGANVVAAEVTDERGWDFVPQARLDMAAIRQERSAHIRDIKNTFWFVHKATESQSRVYYGDVENLPDGLGRFDTAFLLSVLLHCRNPQAILESAARLTDKRVVVTDIHFPELGDLPVMKLIPTGDSSIWDTWWSFTPAFFQQFLGVMGFDRFDLSFHSQPNLGVENQLFTLVAERSTTADSEDTPAVASSDDQPQDSAASGGASAARRLANRLRQGLAHTPGSK